MSESENSHMTCGGGRRLFSYMEISLDLQASRGTISFYYLKVSLEFQAAPLSIFIAFLLQKKHQTLESIVCQTILSHRSFCILVSLLAMDESHERLRGAAQAGNIDELYAIIRENAYILESIDQIPFIDTPLHIAAAAGHTDFAMEIMNLKPSLALKLNSDGFSPIHLALQNGQKEMVLDL
ncbi:hypothetical protein DITRI_Ditri02bG0147000 [Diplodiscus trichospermus]